MLDKSLPFCDIIMKLPAVKVAQAGAPKLPEGYGFHLFRAGDETAWAELEASVLEFDSAQLALDYYTRDYLPYRQELARRAVFVTDPAGRAVATATAWFAESELGYQASLHWVSARPTEQGKGLGKAAVQRALQIFAELEPGKDVYLHTQTWSHRAVWLYHRFGFVICKTARLATPSNGPKGLRIEPNRYAEAMAVLKPVLPPEQYDALTASAV